jgi:iron(III) transport system permease protein
MSAAPLFYIGLRAFGAEPELWSRLWAGQIPPLVFNTLALVFSCVLMAGTMGVTLAWVVERGKLPGRNIWRLVFALPLAVPAYIAALSYIILLRRGGWVDEFCTWLFGLGYGQTPLPNIYSLGGATLAISLCVFPYVYLPVGAALRSSNRTLEEAARMAGRSGWSVFCSVTLPALLPAIAAGSVLVAMYVLSDFGTVSMLRYRTFTTAIFSQLSSQIDRAAASALSMVLIGLALAVLLVESRVAQRERQFIGGSVWRPAQVGSGGRGMGWALVIAVVLAAWSLGLPLLVLGALTVQSFLFPTEADRIWSVGNEGVWQHGLNSLFLSGLAATLATALAIFPGYLSVRRPDRLSRGLLALSKTAYALPGVIVGLAMILLLNQFAPAIYGTVAGLLIGLAFRLLPQSVTTSEAALRAVPPRLEQASRVMGNTTRQTLRRVTLPIAASGLLASWTLVFITAMKELPTVIMLRPPGFDTLPVRVWAAASESVYTQAAPPAFLLIVITAVPLALVYSRRVGRVEIRD